MKLRELSLDAISDEELFGDGTLDKVVRDNAVADERFSKTLLVGFGGKPKGTAGIATVLVPLLEKTGTHARLDIIGNDGPNLCCKEGYPWYQFLTDTLRSGSQINYVLMSPSPEARQKISSLREEFSHSFNAFEPAETEMPKLLADRLQQWKTFHFVLAENPNALWIENYHAPGDIQARDCWYFNEDSALAAELKLRLEEVRPYLKEIL